MAVAHDPGVRGRQVGQRRDSVAGTSQGVVFERMGEREEEQKERALGIRADDGGTGGSQEHQQVDVELESSFEEPHHGLSEQIASPRTRYVAAYSGRITNAGRPRSQSPSHAISRTTPARPATISSRFRRNTAADPVGCAPGRRSSHSAPRAAVRER